MHSHKQAFNVSQYGQWSPGLGRGIRADGGLVLLALLDKSKWEGSWKPLPPQLALCGLYS